VIIVYVSRVIVKYLHILSRKIPHTKTGRNVISHMSQNSLCFQDTEEKISQFPNSTCRSILSLAHKVNFDDEVRSR